MSIDSTDQDLLTRVRSGDSSAFGDLYAHHVAAANRAARRIARDQSTAEDIVSESFARVFSALQNGKGPDGDLFPYLLVTMRNVAATWGRDTNRWTPVGDDLAFQPRDARDLVEGADAAPVDDLAVALTSSAFATLPRRWRTVLWYLEVEGESATEVGQRIGLSDVAVRQLAKRAREGLREAYLTAYLGGGPVVGSHVPSSDLVQMARGKISLRRRVQVEQHLDSCPDCTRLLFEATEENSTLRALAIPFWLAAGLFVARAGTSIASTVGGWFRLGGKSGRALAGSAAGAGTVVVGAVAALALIVGVATGQVGGSGGGRSSAGGNGGGGPGGGSGSTGGAVPGGASGGASGSGGGGPSGSTSPGTGGPGTGGPGTGTAGPTPGSTGTTGATPTNGGATSTDRGAPGSGGTVGPGPGGTTGPGATTGPGTTGGATTSPGTTGPTTTSPTTTPPITAGPQDLTWKWQPAVSGATLKITNNTATSWGIDATITLAAGVNLVVLPAYCDPQSGGTVVCHLNQNRGDNLGPLAPGSTSFHVLSLLNVATEVTAVTYVLVPTS